MIGTEFYSGQGLGNQLWSYAVIRSIAERQGFDYGFLGTKRFKAPWMKLDFGDHNPKGTSSGPETRIPQGFTNYISEEMQRHESGADISPLDPKVLNAPDGAFVDGVFQSENYFHNIDEVKSWFYTGLATRDVCTVNIRGGEFKGTSDLFLTKSYYASAIEEMRLLTGIDRFEIVTDDPALAKKWFPTLPVFSSGGVKRFHGGIYLHPSSDRIRKDFERLQTSKFIISSNSSFSWWGAFTNRDVEVVIAPKYWARHNSSDGFWSNGDSLTRGWLWLDRDGALFSYEQCRAEIAKPAS